MNRLRKYLVPLATAALALGPGGITCLREPDGTASYRIPSATVAWGQTDDQQAMVSAAIDNALRTLRDTVGAEHITHDVTVQQFVDATDGRREFQSLLRHARMIGGPRWADEQTCEVRIQIDGPSVAQMLEALGQSDPTASPIPLDLLQRRMLSWQDRVFSATGASAAPADADQVLPPPAAAGWADVPDDARKAAIDAARHDAARRVVKSIEPAPLTKGTTVGDALAVPTVGDAVNDWIDGRPTSLVNFLDGQKVEVTLCAEPDDLFDVFQGAVRKQKTVPYPADASGWTNVKLQIAARMAPAVGDAVVADNTAEGSSGTNGAGEHPGGEHPGDEASPGITTEPSSRPAWLLPKQAPIWIDRQIQADGVGGPGPTLLQAGRVAEDIAIEHLRSRVKDLALTPELTVGQAAEHDSRIADALDRALTHAQVAKADYRSDGRVFVTVSLDLTDVWEELIASP